MEFIGIKHIQRMTASGRKCIVIKRYRKSLQIVQNLKGSERLPVRFVQSKFTISMGISSATSMIIWMCSRMISLAAIRS